MSTVTLADKARGCNGANVVASYTGSGGSTGSGGVTTETLLAGCGGAFNLLVQPESIVAMTNRIDNSLMKNLCTLPVYGN